MQMLGGRDATPSNQPADDGGNQGDPFSSELHKAPPVNLVDSYYEDPPF